MGLFNKSIDEKDVMITTTENIPGRKYQIISIISATKINFSKANLKQCFEELIKQSRKLDADAVVSVRVINVKFGFSYSYAYGTAVKYID